MCELFGPAIRGNPFCQREIAKTSQFLSESHRGDAAAAVIHRGAATATVRIRAQTNCCSPRDCWCRVKTHTPKDLIRQRCNWNVFSFLLIFHFFIFHDQFRSEGKCRSGRMFTDEFFYHVACVETVLSWRSTHSLPSEESCALGWTEMISNQRSTAQVLNSQTLFFFPTLSYR